MMKEDMQVIGRNRGHGKIEICNPLRLDLGGKEQEEGGTQRQQVCLLFFFPLRWHLKYHNTFLNIKQLLDLLMTKTQTLPHKLLTQKLSPLKGSIPVIYCFVLRFMIYSPCQPIVKNCRPPREPPCKSGRWSASTFWHHLFSFVMFSPECIQLTTSYTSQVKGNTNSFSPGNMWETFFFSSSQHQAVE